MAEITIDPNYSHELLNNNRSGTIIQFSGSSSSPAAFCASSPPRQWTWDDHNNFQYALTRVPLNAPNRWQVIASLIPGKSEKEVVDYYNSLCLLNMNLKLEVQANSPDSAVAPPHQLPAGAPRSEHGDQAGNRRRKPWSKREHQLFLLGLKKYGKGDWKNISRNVVVSRTPSQVASHAQKFFLRRSKNQQSNRSSIHDITTVDRDFEVAFADQNCRNQSNRIPLIEQLPPPPPLLPSQPPLPPSLSSSLPPLLPLPPLPPSLERLPLSSLPSMPPQQFKSLIFHNYSNIEYRSL